jgi:acyl carrier protein
MLIFQNPVKATQRRQSPPLLDNEGKFAMPLDALEQELLEMIVDICDLPGPPPADYAPTDPLIGPDSPLGLDSLDAVEIIVTVQMNYGLRIDAENVGRTILQSLRSLADFVRQQRPATA